MLHLIGPGLVAGRAASSPRPLRSRPRSPRPNVNNTAESESRPTPLRRRKSRSPGNSKPTGSLKTLDLDDLRQLHPAPTKPIEPGPAVHLPCCALREYGNFDSAADLFAA